MTVGGRVRRGMQHAAAVAVLAGGASWGLASPAAAAVDLATAVSSSTSADVLDDRVVARAARGAFDDGRVTVKVIAWRDTPGAGDLYDALLAARRQCNGWGFTGGGRQSLLVLGVSVDGRELGSHYDGRAFGRFDAARDDVELDGMGPAFGNGAWTDGMLAGLAGYADAYASQGSDNDSGARPGRLPDGYDPFPDDPDDTASSGGADVPGWALGVPVGLAAVGGAGWGATRVRRRLKARAAARAALGTATSAMAQAWFELDESNELIDARVAALPRGQRLGRRRDPCRARAGRRGPGRRHRDLPAGSPSCTPTPPSPTPTPTRRSARPTTSTRRPVACGRRRPRWPRSRCGSPPTTRCAPSCLPGSPRCAPGRPSCPG